MVGNRMDCPRYRRTPPWHYFYSVGNAFLYYKRKCASGFPVSAAKRRVMNPYSAGFTLVAFPVRWLRKENSHNHDRAVLKNRAAGSVLPDCGAGMGACDKNKGCRQDGDGGLRHEVSPFRLRIGYFTYCKDISEKYQAVIFPIPSSTARLLLRFHTAAPSQITGQGDDQRRQPD